MKESQAADAHIGLPAVRGNRFEKAFAGCLQGGTEFYLNDTGNPIRGQSAKLTIEKRVPPVKS